MLRRIGFARTILIPALAAWMLLAPVQPVQAASLWFVSAWNGSDKNACNTPVAPCRTIDAAIAKALAGDTIDVTADPYTNPGGSEVVKVTKNLTINGGWNSSFSTQIGYTILNGQNKIRGLVIPAGVTAQIGHVAVVWGFDLDGAGVLVQGTLNADHMLVGENVGFRGPGFFVDGAASRLNLSQAAILGNEYFVDGGGFYVNGGTVYIGDVTVTGNLSINSVDEEHGSPPTFGGGVYLYRGYFWASNSTFAENTRYDGRVFTQSGAGLANAFSYGAIQIANVLISDGCSGYIQSAGNNLERANTCQLGASGDLPNTNPQIFPADVNGGNTVTHALAPSSPAIDVASSIYCGSPSADQRGVSRPQGSGCDIGAFERKPDDPQQDVVGGTPCPPSPTGLPASCAPNSADPFLSLLVPASLQLAEESLQYYSQAGLLKPQLLDPLTKRLEHAGTSFSDGRKFVAINQMNAFIFLVRAQRGRMISTNGADRLIAGARGIIELLALAPRPAAGLLPGSGPAAP